LPGALRRTKGIFWPFVSWDFRVEFICSRERSPRLFDDPFGNFLVDPLDQLLAETRDEPRLFLKRLTATEYPSILRIKFCELRAAAIVVVIVEIDDIADWRERC